MKYKRAVKHFHGHRVAITIGNHAVAIDAVWADPAGDVNAHQYIDLSREELAWIVEQVNA